MTDREIIKKFIEKTELGLIKWFRYVKNTGDPKLNVSYKCNFVEGEMVEISNTKFTDYNTLGPRYSFRLSFFDKTNYCYKKISPQTSDAEYYSLKKTI